MNAPSPMMNPATLPMAVPAPSSDEFDLHEALDTLLQYAWLIGIVLVLALAAGVGYALLAPPIYRADALVQVEEKKGTTLGGLQQIAAALEVGQSPTQGEIEILRSREVLMKAIAATSANLEIDVANRFPLLGQWMARRYERLNDDLAPAPAAWLAGYAWGGEKVELSGMTVPEAWHGERFILVAMPGNRWQLRDSDDASVAEGAVGQQVDFNLGGRTARLGVKSMQAKPGTKFSVVPMSPVEAYAAILRELRVAETARQSSVIRVSFEHENRDFAVRLLNELASAYLSQNVGRRSAEAQQSLNFLEQQLPQLKKSMESAEEALNAFRTRTSTINVDKETEALLDKSVQIERNRVELGLKRSQLLQRFLPDHPDLRAVTDQLSSMDRENNRINDTINKLPAQQRDLLRLMRDVQVGTQLYTALLNNAQELRIAKAGTIGNVRIIDYAVESEKPVRPQRGLIVSVALVLGLLLGIVAAFAARSLRPTLRSTEAIEQTTGLVTYAAVPESKIQERLLPRKDKHSGRRPQQDTSKRLLTLAAPEDPAIESLKSMRTGLTFALLGSENKTIVITGPTAGLGKSFVSSNLCAVLAQADKRVLLIETDLRRPLLHVYFGLTKGRGLTDVLAGEAPVDAALRRDVVPGLDVLPAGSTPPNPAELLMAPQFKELIDRVQTDYDYVVLDSAPVLPVGDTLALVQHAAATFIVVRAEESTAREVRDAARRLETAGANIKGVIFNAVKKSRIGYGYGYYYKYYSGYRSAS